MSKKDLIDAVAKEAELTKEKAAVAVDAALEHAAWCAQGRLPPRIAVNVSPAQLRRRDFVDNVRDALAPGLGGAWSMTADPKKVKRFP